MALEGAVMGCGEDSKRNESQHQYDPYFNKVRKNLEPLEKRWSYVQDVVLWKEPVHSLCYLAGINCAFGYLTTDTLRHVCIVLTVLSLTLCVGEVRMRVSPILERGGIGTPVEGKSPENTVPFSGVCNKLAILWSCGALYYTKLLELKTNSSIKFFGIIFIAFVVFSFAYQYLPLAAMLYVIVSALYLWPGIRYYGIHYKVRNLVRPFYAPITTQWEHSRTKRERTKLFKFKKGEEPVDSDDDFTSELNLEDDVTQSQTDRECLVDTEPEILTDPPVDDKCHSSLSQPNTDDSSSEGKMTGSILSFDESFMSADRQDSRSSLDSQGYEGSSISPDSSQLFVEGMNFQSVSQIQETERFDLDDQDFMQGLEFPDIEDGYDSSTESLHLKVSGNSNKSKKDRASQQQSKRVGLPSQAHSGQNTKNRPTHMQSQKVIMPSSGHSSLSDDFEVLDSSEADELDMQGDSGAGAPSLLGSAVTSYFGKWLGYSN